MRVRNGRRPTEIQAHLGVQRHKGVRDAEFGSEGTFVKVHDWGRYNNLITSSISEMPAGAGLIIL